MIRAILGLFVPAALRAIDEAEARATAAELNEARALGARDEARLLRRDEADRANALLAQCEANAAQIAEQYREIETLRSEVASASEECDEATELRIGLGRADVRIGQLQREREELQRRCGDLSVRAVDADGMILALQVEGSRLAAQLAEATESRDVWRNKALDAKDVADASAVPKDERCAWCLGYAEDGWFGAGNYVAKDPARRRASVNAHEAHPLCDECVSDIEVEGDTVRARVATRAASCPTRRASPDPLAIACPTCGAMRGETCSAASFLGKPGDSAR